MARGGPLIVGVAVGRNCLTRTADNSSSAVTFHRGRFWEATATNNVGICSKEMLGVADGHSQ